MHFFVGNEQDKYESEEVYNFSTIVMKQENSQKYFFLYISKLKERISQDIVKYDPKTKVGSTYGELSVELKKEIDRLTENIVKPKDIYDFRLWLSYYYGGQADTDVITARLYTTRVVFEFDKSKILDPPNLIPLRLNIIIK